MHKRRSSGSSISHFLHNFNLDLLILTSNREEWFADNWRQGYPKEFLYDVILAQHDRCVAAEKELLTIHTFQEFRDKRAQYYST